MREFVDEEAKIKDIDGRTLTIRRRSVRDADGKLHNPLLWMSVHYWTDPQTGDVYDYNPDTKTVKCIFKHNGG